MTDQEINIVIAEACGWTAPDDCTRTPKHKWKSPLDGCCYDQIPSYTTDLNAMHEAEKILDPIIPENVNVYSDTWEKYAGELEHICEHSDPKHCAHHTTARQRAEAFLRTIGKWKEDEV